MTLSMTDCLLAAARDHHDLDDYAGGVSRWCTGCGDNAILAAMQRLCRDEQLAPERTVFVSGIGCSSRLPHYMHTYGFHGLHGRALPLAEGIKIRRPDLNVFVNTGDGDCCAIGTAHWIHAVRYNMDLTVVMHDNEVYGLTKNQTSPTSPRGLVSNTAPHGAWLEPLDPLSITLAISNVSFVAQCVDWIPELVHDVIAAGFRHQGFSFIRILQRCPEYLDGHFDEWKADPERIQILRHADGVEPSDGLSRIYRNQLVHDPGDLRRAQELATGRDPIPVGVLYRNDDVPRYEDLRRPDHQIGPDEIERAMNAEFDRFAIRPANDHGDGR